MTLKKLRVFFFSYSVNNHSNAELWTVRLTRIFLKRVFQKYLSLFAINNTTLGFLHQMCSFIKLMHFPSCISENTWATGVWTQVPWHCKHIHYPMVPQYNLIFCTYNTLSPFWSLTFCMGYQHSCGKVTNILGGKLPTSYE